MTGAAPLLATPAAPIPPGGAAEWFTGAGGARLRAALFVPPGTPRGSVVVSPGRTEVIEKYFEVAQGLMARGFTVLAHDWRGQGLSQRLLSDRLLGHAVGHADFLTDYRALLDAFASRLPGPWIALGHSMGGCLTLLALAQGGGRLSGAILSAPMLGILTGAVPPPFAALLAAGLTLVGGGALSVARQAAAATPFEANILTHDRARYERNEALIAAWPDLALGGPTWGWLAFAFGAVFSLEHGTGVTRITPPLTVAMAGADRLVDNAGLRRIVSRVPGARLVEIPGAYHEILQETDALQAAFWREFDDLAARVGA